MTNIFSNPYLLGLTMVGFSTIVYVVIEALFKNAQLRRGISLPTHRRDNWFALVFLMVLTATFGSTLILTLTSPVDKGSMGAFLESGAMLYLLIPPTWTCLKNQLVSTPDLGRLRWSTAPLWLGQKATFWCELVKWRNAERAPEYRVQCCQAYLDDRPSAVLLEIKGKCAIEYAQARAHATFAFEIPPNAKPSNGDPHRGPIIEWYACLNLDAHQIESRYPLIVKPPKRS